MLGFGLTPFSEGVELRGSAELLLDGAAIVGIVGVVWSGVA